MNKLLLFPTRAYPVALLSRQDSCRQTYLQHMDSYYFQQCVHVYYCREGKTQQKLERNGSCVPATHCMKEKQNSTFDNTRLDQSFVYFIDFLYMPTEVAYTILLCSISLSQQPYEVGMTRVSRVNA